MKTWQVLIALQLLAAALSLFGLASFYLGHLLDPAIPGATSITLGAAVILVVALTFAVIGALFWRREAMASGLVIAAVGATLLTALAGYGPRLVNAQIEQQQAVDRVAENRRAEQQFLAELAHRRGEIEAHIRERRLMAPDDALDLLMFLERADFADRGLPDHTPEALLLLRRALEAGIIDPNGSVIGERLFGPAASASAIDELTAQLAALERAPSSSLAERNTVKAQLQIMSHSHQQFLALRGKPLFLYYYAVAGFDDAIKYHYESRMPHQWEMIDLLTGAGADLSRPDAATVVAALAARKEQSGR